MWRQRIDACKSNAVVVGRVLELACASLNENGFVAPDAVVDESPSQCLLRLEMQSLSAVRQVWGLLSVCFEVLTENICEDAEEEEAGEGGADMGTAGVMRRDWSNDAKIETKRGCVVTTDTGWSEAVKYDMRGVVSQPQPSAGGRAGTGLLRGSLTCWSQSTLGHGLLIRWPFRERMRLCALPN